MSFLCCLQSLSVRSIFTYVTYRVYLCWCKFCPKVVTFACYKKAFQQNFSSVFSVKIKRLQEVLCLKNSLIAGNTSAFFRKKSVQKIILNSWYTFKGTLMQIWKSQYMNVYFSLGHYLQNGAWMQKSTLTIQNSPKLISGDQVIRPKATAEIAQNRQTSSIPIEVP